MYKFGSFKKRFFIQTVSEYDFGISVIFSMQKVNIWWF